MIKNEGNMHANLVKQVGLSSRQKFGRLVEFYLFSLAVLGRMFRFYRLKGQNRTVLFRQIMFTGYDALLLIGFISISTSILIVLEVNQIMGQLGKGRLVYDLLVVIVVQQLSSLFTALIVIARSGTAIATELGNMVVHNEIDLLNSFGISPLSYLVVPRVFGVIVALFTLTLYFNLLAVVGAAVFSDIAYHVDFNYFLGRYLKELSYSDFFMPVIKSLLFGLAVGLISCYQGLRVERANTEVPQRTMHSVVYSVVSIILLNIAVTLVYFL